MSPLLMAICAGLQPSPILYNTEMDKVRSLAEYADLEYTFAQSQT